MTTAILTWSCIAVCPECEHDNDLSVGEWYDAENVVDALPGNDYIGTINNANGERKHEQDRDGFTP